MKSSLRIKKNFMLKSYRSEYFMSLDLLDLALSDLLDALLSEIVPSAAFENRELIDVKGADNPNLASGERPETPGGQEELVSVTGRVVSDELDIEQQDFQARIVTNFKEFSGKDKIHHSSKVLYRGSLPADFPMKEIGRAVPVEISKFCIGMDFFRPSFAWASLGSSPDVYETLFVECTPKEFSLQLISENLKDPDSLPLASESRLEKLDAIFVKVLNVSILKDYREKLKER